MSWVMEMLQGIPVNAVLREKILLIEEKIKRFEDEKKRLEDEVVSLRKENNSLRAQLTPLALDLEYTEECGVLWKRRPNGTFHYQPYCPICKIAMTKYTPSIVGGYAPKYKFRCPKCVLVSDVYETDAPEIIKSLT